MFIQDDLTRDTGELRVGTEKIERIYLKDIIVYQLGGPEEYDEVLLYDVNNIATEFLT